MGQSLLILGAGQYGAVAKETAQAMGCFDRMEFLDDNNPAAIGKLSDCEQLHGVFSHAFVAMGNPELRLSWLDRLEEAGYDLPALIHPMAYVSPSAKLMAGSIVEPMAVVQSGAVVERGCLLCAGCVVNHNSHVMPGCQIDCGAIVESNASVPEGTKVLCGTVVHRK